MEEQQDYPACNTRNSNKTGKGNRNKEGQPLSQSTPQKSLKSKSTARTPKKPKTPKAVKTPKKVKKLSEASEGSKDIRRFLVGNNYDAFHEHDKIVSDSESYKLKGVTGLCDPLHGRLLSGGSPKSLSVSTTSFHSAVGSEEKLNNLIYEDACVEDTFKGANSTVELESTINWSCLEQETGSVNKLNDMQNTQSESIVQSTPSPRRQQDNVNIDESLTPQKTTHSREMQTQQTTMGENEITTATPAEQTTVLKNAGMNADMKENKNPSIPNDTMRSEGGSKLNTISMENVLNKEVKDMFAELMQQINSMQTSLHADITEIKKVQTGNVTDIKTLQDQQRTCEAQAKVQRKELQFCNKKVEQLADVVSYQNHVIKELREKIDALEMDKVQGNLFFKGITEKKDENCVQVVKSCLKNQVELAMDIPIKNAFRVGKSKNRPIKAILVNASDKFKIFAHTKNLQGKKNEHKKPYRVEEQLPAKQGAAKNKMRHIMW